MSKQYGLNFLKRDRGHQIGQLSASKPSIFEDDSDIEEEPKRPTGIPKGLKKQDKISQEKAVADDPTVYQYDEVYDNIEKNRNESKLARKDLDKTPKYINKLLVAADKRKRENDRRIERQVQKEREEEGDVFKDKESFITPSYKKKLEELRELEEQEKREEYLESIGDVKKQGNLDGFYRHLYDQKVNYEDKKEEKVEEIKDETADKIKEEQNSDNDEQKSHGGTENTETMLKQAPKRKYRSRKESGEDSNSQDEPEVKKEHLPSNIDADSDFSINSSDSEDEKDSKQINQEKEKPEKTAPAETTEDPIEEKNNSEEKVDIKKEEVKLKPKIDVWKKRTVGENFDEAVKRYFGRKALREMGQ